MQNIQTKPIYKTTLSAVMIALSTALAMIPAIQLPFGGSITVLSMLPIIMVSLILGIKWGLASSFAFSLIELLLDIGKIPGWGLTPTALVACIFLDYLFAFTALGLAGVFSKKSYWGACFGTVLAIVLRFFCHFISGVVIWGAYAEGTFMRTSLVGHPVLYSLVYNGIYMIPELIATTVAAMILFRLPQIKRLISTKE